MLKVGDVVQVKRDYEERGIITRVYTEKGFYGPSVKMVSVKGGDGPYWQEEFEASRVHVA